MILTTKHQRLTALRPLYPESVASLAAAWDVAADCIRPAKFPKVIEGMVDVIRRHTPYQFPDLRKLITFGISEPTRRHIPINFLTSGN
jgi:hypothetical protein